MTVPADSGRVCPRCGSQVPEASQYCGSCGARFVNAPAPDALRPFATMGRWVLGVVGGFVSGALSTLVVALVSEASNPGAAVLVGLAVWLISTVLIGTAVGRAWNRLWLVVAIELFLLPAATVILVVRLVLGSSGMEAFGIGIGGGLLSVLAAILGLALGAAALVGYYSTRPGNKANLQQAARR